MPIDVTEFFLIGDQPTTCPCCGSRTDWDDLYYPEYLQLHWCMNMKCGFTFVAIED